jgi:hypothetical protein
MRLIPPFQAMITFGQKAKFASLVARQATISARICTGTTWELSANLVLDRSERQLGRSLRQVLMAIPSKIFPNKPLFHTIDRLWRSQNGTTFTFLPENEEEARFFIAGLIPFISATESPCFLKLLIEEAKARHAHSRWDPATRQVFSAKEAELEELLAEDNETNKSDEPTLVQQSTHVEVNVPNISYVKNNPILHKDNDSVSTFQTHSTLL